MAGPNEPSMEDILASIKKVIAEDGIDAPARPVVEDKAEEQTAEAANEDVLDLDESMADPEDGAGHDPETPPAKVASLMAEEATSGARSSLEQLASIARDAPEQAAANPLEDLVREMLRPMLKQWLDERLPGIVDEHVRAEIKRITGRKL
ncbi:DUF2497 domain-containing protein [Sphingomicrobium sediminis]|uniref:DUF2497 domain-containing protein n=1 Tax=Sphingomicrobium sediminis TaxID=2950949 RepID=A0A9X2EEX8_9SPHN|nr:DUF2497 domain-containing protein [Sphingomicrobium sediminis]MCM8556340.1 DUF2497 domain-containing protein [Sphingomicrobium sediminis]